LLRVTLVEREQRVARLPELLAGDLQVARLVAAEQRAIARRRYAGLRVGKRLRRDLVKDFALLLSASTGATMTSS
jgi:hypothetical protein